MQFLAPVEAAILGAIAVIWIGIAVEKHYVSWDSVYANTLSFILVLGSVDLSIPVFLLLLIYTILGYIAVKMRWKKVFPAFGSKSYGSLMFVLSMGSAGYLFAIQNPIGVAICWILVALLVHWIGYWYKKR